ncbi:hypothetical protein D3273_24630 [Lichenibacterium minor]|uniref:Uncharacterized protein n=1 Tax=Lichenibacterium minor TaxID=2316528 RepID=A0A4Q2TZT7_9HYPH|nr:hypothetical protein [Lichenibacterium minor]RYC29300.1 hypothetical protein D3273_24630 [Lichenibacterium minor]
MTTATIPDDLRPRLGKFVRLLASDQPGDVVAAATAIKRALAAHGADLNDLGDDIDRHAEPLVIYVDRPQTRRQSRAEAGHIDWTSSHRIHVAATLERGLIRFPFNQWERDFIGNIVGRLRNPRSRLTFKQAEVAERLVAKVEHGR